MAETCSHLLADAARRGALSLTDEGRSRIAGFVLAQRQADGGFRGRSSASDRYYTFFAIRVLKALDAPLPAAEIAAHLRGFRHGDGLDFVHLACLACASADVLPGERDEEVLARLETFRAADGGYAEKRGAAQSTAYGAFLAVQAYEAQGAPLPNRAALARSVESLAPNVTTAVAARAILLTSLGITPPDSVGAVLLDRAARRGGFRAAALAPIADLLSTATALCALRALGQPLDGIREATLAFVHSLWHDRGGFRGHGVDLTPDCEYTYYALLSLGVLAPDDDCAEEPSAARHSLALHSRFPEHAACLPGGRTCGEPGFSAQSDDPA